MRLLLKSSLRGLKPSKFPAGFADFFIPVRSAKKIFNAFSSLLFFNASAFIMRYNICIDENFFTLILSLLV